MITDLGLLKHYLDIYEEWLWAESTLPAPFGWTFTQYEDMCEYYIAARKQRV
jgi:hypothetical protein